MQVRKIYVRSIALVLIAAYASASSLAVAGDNARPSNCDSATAAIVGGLFGALMGGHNKAKGAAIGAGLASLACLAVNYESRQTASGASARDDFSRRTGRAPSTIGVENYVAANAMEVVDRQAAQRQTIRTSGTVIIPAGLESNSEEEIAIFPPGETTPLEPTRKPVSIGLDGGGFENAFSLPLNKQSPQGIYRYKVRLITNGNVIGERIGSFQAV